ncbi:MAG TPA: OsmC family protein [Bryobacteraceae bacterium]|jgi:putative redox protein|nr:OsmC family protein [Bryobacteraceae bacterium]
MNVSIQHLGDCRFAAETRGHKLFSDQPFDNGGTDTAMTPPELLLASLGTCAGYYAAQYLRTRNLPVEGLNLRVSAEKGTQPARFIRFHVTVTTPELESRHMEGLLRAVNACMVHHTLQHQPHVTFSLAVADDSKVVAVGS